MADDSLTQGAQALQAQVSLRQYLLTYVGQAVTVYLMGVHGHKDQWTALSEVEDEGGEVLGTHHGPPQHDHECDPCQTLVVTGTLAAVGTDFIEIRHCCYRSKKRIILIPFCTIGVIMTGSR